MVVGLTMATPTKSDRQPAGPGTCRGVQLSLWGAWMSPDGEIFPIETREGHTALLIENMSLIEGLDATKVRGTRDLDHLAADHGWINFSFNPEERSLSIGYPAFTSRSTMALAHGLARCFPWDVAIVNVTNRCSTHQELGQLLRKLSDDEPPSGIIVPPGRK